MKSTTKSLCAFALLVVVSLSSFSQERSPAIVTIGNDTVVTIPISMVETANEMFVQLRRYECIVDSMQSELAVYAQVTEIRDEIIANKYKQMKALDAIVTACEEKCVAYEEEIVVLRKDRWGWLGSGFLGGVMVMLILL